MLKRNCLSLNKSIVLIFPVLIFFVSNNSWAQAKQVSIVIHGVTAKKLYDHLTGPKIHGEGAAGTLYSEGLSVLCKTNHVDASDENGKDIPINDPSRYTCAIKFDSNGLASPSEDFSE